MVDVTRLTTPQIKVQSVIDLGGEAVLQGDDYDAACEHALTLARERELVFVHPFDDPDVIAATCEYGGTLNAAFRSGNVFATQFHPEKSGSAGLALLANFVAVARGR